MYPENFRYTKEHEWVHVENGVGTIGITDHAQHELGDIVYVEVPKVGTHVEQGKSFEGAKVRDQIETISGFQGTTGVYNMSPTVHQGITVNPFLLASIIGGRVIVAK